MPYPFLSGTGIQIAIWTKHFEQLWAGFIKFQCINWSSTKRNNSLCSLLKQFYFKCYFHFKNSLSKMPYSNKLSIKIIDTKGYLNDILQLVLIPEHIISVITIIKLPGVYIVCLCKKLDCAPLYSCESNWFLEDLTVASNLWYFSTMSKLHRDGTVASQMSMWRGRHGKRTTNNHAKINTCFFKNRTHFPYTLLCKLDMFLIIY